jgi:hypothetical protein
LKRSSFSSLISLSSLETHMDLQHINVKLFITAPAPLRTGDYTGVFNGWIQERALGELLVDVADYGHVHHGPGLLLIGHEANYSLDETGGRLGLLYNRKAPVEGTAQERLRQAVRQALLAAQKLATEQNFQFDVSQAQVILNDRHLAPNTPETFAALRPELETLFNTLYGGAAFTLTHSSLDPRERLTVDVSTTAGLDLAALLANLEAEKTYVEPG